MKCELNVNMSNQNNIDRSFRHSSLSRTTTTTSVTPVHPMELVVQSLLESPLELLNLSIHSLYESQMILTTILDRMQRKLNKCLQNVNEYGSETINANADSQSPRDNGEPQVNSVNSTPNLNIIAEPDKNASIEGYAARVHKIKLRINKILNVLDHVENLTDR